MNNQRLGSLLVLGANGMLGRIIFAYFKSENPDFTWGTRRKLWGKKILKFDAKTCDKDFKKIFKKLKKIDYVINCIGIVEKNADINEVIKINALLPHKLEQFAQKYGFRLIHVSSDAVFSETQTLANEKILPMPTTIYGFSKFLGETFSKNAITFRTSILGFDPKDHKGILEWTLGRKKRIKNYTNQKWSGCTTLQFAKLCGRIISQNKFEFLRKKSPIFHFAPLGPIDKYKIVKTILKESHLHLKIRPFRGNRLTRVLTTLYFDYLFDSSYTNKIDLALRELLLFEKTLKKHV